MKEKLKIAVVNHSNLELDWHQIQEGTKYSVKTVTIKKSISKILLETIISFLKKEWKIEHEYQAIELILQGSLSLENISKWQKPNVVIKQELFDILLKEKTLVFDDSIEEERKKRKNIDPRGM